MHAQGVWAYCTVLYMTYIVLVHFFRICHAVEDEIMKLLQGEAEEDEKDDNDENYFMKKYPSHEKDGTPGGDEERAGDRAGGPYA